ncbi:MAG: hypothetical protein F6K26_51630 [Moorea sp. SIO2I5]|nr:hypothetical protein [Moorena sp. SIO2I5]
MTKTYTKPDLIIHGNVEEITLNTGNTPDTDLIILTGLPNGIPDVQAESVVGGCRNLQIDAQTGGITFVD